MRRLFFAGDELMLKEIVGARREIVESLDRQNIAAAAQDRQRRRRNVEILINNRRRVVVVRGRARVERHVRRRFAASAKRKQD